MPDIAASISTSAVITVGTALTSTIDTLGDHDWYRVELEAGHTYSFALDGTILQGGSALVDPELTLRDAAGGGDCHERRRRRRCAQELDD